MLVYIASTTFASAQLDVPSLTSDIDLALQKSDWANAEVQLERILAAFLHQHSIPGASAGTLRFKKGWCELKLQKWEEAAQSFERCYKSGRDRKENPYRLLALRGWADATMGAGDGEQAAKLYRRYIEEASSTNWVNPFDK